MLGGAVTKDKSDTWKTRGQACQSPLRADGNKDVRYPLNLTMWTRW